MAINGSWQLTAHGMCLHSDFVQMAVFFSAGLVQATVG